MHCVERSATQSLSYKVDVVVHLLLWFSKESFALFDKNHQLSLNKVNNCWPQVLHLPWILKLRYFFLRYNTNTCFFFCGVAAKKTMQIILHGKKNNIHLQLMVNRTNWWSLLSENLLFLSFFFVSLFKIHKFFLSYFSVFVQCEMHFQCLHR